MNKCYRNIASVKGNIDKNCLRCSYWRTSMKSGSNYECTCYNFWNCKAECDFKNGGNVSMARISPSKQKSENGEKNLNKNILTNVDDIINVFKIWLEK